MIRILIPAAVLAACNGGAPANVECVDHADCSGALDACIDDRCVEVECITSSSCALYEYCAPETYECTDGCLEDSDCLAGEACDADNHVCEPYGCRDTDLDCEIGQYCNQSSGRCEDAEYGHCEWCDVFFPDCPSGFECFLFDEPYAWDGYCLKSCNPSNDDACPRGLDCVDVTGYSEYYCAAWCPTLIENGWI